MSQIPFSYAQAAKGHIASQPSPQPTASSAPPSVSSQEKDDATTTSTAATILTTTSGDNDTSEPAKQSQPNDEHTPQKPQAEATVASSSGPSNTLTNGDSAVHETTRQLSEEKSRRSPSRTSRSTDGEARKGRKGKKSRNHDKDSEADKAQEDKEEKEPQKPIILSEAPIPSVNIWHKRREAHAAKAKPVPQTAPSANTAPVEDLKTRSSSEPAEAPNGTHEGAIGEKPQQRKSVDLSRSAEQHPRRSGPRGSRGGEKDEKSGAESLPSVADASLWPDVKSAVAADDGKKPQDKGERVDKEAQDGAAPSKRSKKEWVAIPYVPTVNFQTPMPQRSSKPRGGARGGREAGTTRSTHSSAAGANNATVTSPTAEKGQGIASAVPTKESRHREGSASTGANSQPPSASKRGSIDAGSIRDARKPSVPASADRPREQTGESQAHAGNVKAENARAGQPGVEQQPQSVSRSFNERRGEAGYRSVEGPKETGAPTSKEQNFTGRDRAEGQNRGRGSYRARGGHGSTTAGHQQSGYSVNGQYPVHTLPSRQTGPYSPPAHQNAFGNAYGAGSTRGGGRGSGRGHSGASSYGRVNSNGAGPARMAPVNPPSVSYDFQMPQYGVYSAIPFQPVFDNGLISVLTAQIEYYLSVDNLCKDFFLRKHMDSQGFVPFELIAGFQRVKMMAPDVNHIRMSCEVSDKMDYVVGDDHVERLRLRDLWDRFVLPMEEREEAARNEGPSQFIMRSRHSKPAFAGPMMDPIGYPASSPSMFPGGFSGEEQMYQQPYMNGAPYEPGMNNGDLTSHRFAPETQLSAAVPEFSPGAQQVPFTLEGATTFSDEQVEKLMVLVEVDKKEPSTPAIVNGSDGASDHAHTNGVVQDATSPSGVQSPPGAPKNIVWAEDQKSSNLGPQQIPQRYVDLRKKAFDERHGNKPGETSRDMQTLYKFWSHFLVREFNSRMYDDFRNCALEDAGKEKPAPYGLKYLLQFYNELLHGDKQKPWGNDRPIPEIFKLHHQGALLMDPTYRTTNGETRI